MIACHNALRPRLEWQALYRFFAATAMSPLLILLLMLAPPATSFAADPQTLTEYQIKAGFFFNFTRFVEWPENAFATPTSPIIVCVVGETPLTDLLTDVAVGKVVNGRAVSINRAKATDDLRRCNLLFISAAAERRTGEILASVKKANTLTVGETAGFPQAGGMINFSIEDNKVKLEMNLDAATRAGLKVNSKLIAVSRLVSSNSAAEAN
jgi:YfiR/HmsC-like